MAVGRQTIKSTSTYCGKDRGTNDEESDKKRKRLLQQRCQKKQKKSVLRPRRDKNPSQSWNCLVILAVTANQFTGKTSGMTYCPENQTAELGEQKIISCNFPQSSFVVYWCAGTPPEGSYFIKYIYYSHEKQNTGFLNNSFDVTKDGSLVILKVRAEHEGNYTVIVDTGQDPFHISNVSLKVVVNPLNRSPSIACVNCQQNYYHVEEGEDSLTCQFNMSRPAVQLEWMQCFQNQCSPVAEQIPIHIVDNKDGTYNSSRTIFLKRNDLHPIIELVCIASLEKRHTVGQVEIVLDFTNRQTFEGIAHHTLYREVNKKSVLSCEGSGKGMTVWKRLPDSLESETIGFSTRNITRKTTKVNGIELSEHGSLVFPDMQIEYEGRYVCLYSDGEENRIISTKQFAVVPPSPPCIQIKGCNENDMERCELKEEDTDLASCGLYDTRPGYVVLQWVAINPIYLYLSPSNSSVTVRGETFDFIQETTFKIDKAVPCGEEVWLECRVYGPIGGVIKSRRRAQILPEHCKTKKNTWNFLQVILAIFVTGLTLCIIVILIRITWRRLIRCAPSFAGNYQDQNRQLEVDAENLSCEAQESGVEENRGCAQQGVSSRRQRYGSTSESTCEDGRSDYIPIEGSSTSVAGNCQMGDGQDGPNISSLDRKQTSGSLGKIRGFARREVLKRRPYGNTESSSLVGIKFSTTDGNLNKGPSPTGQCKEKDGLDESGL